jgi:PKD repeat protein
VTLLPDPFSEFTYSLFGTEIQLNHQPASLPDSLRWNFGDGQTSTETNPLHFFETSGIFNICLTTYLSGCSSQTCKPVQISVTTLSGSSGAGIQVVPNPSRGLYEISIENLRGTARIEVLDALGKQVYKGEVHSQGGNTFQQLDIRHVAMGVYTLRLQTSDGPKFIRLKKE